MWPSILDQYDYSIAKSYFNFIVNSTLIPNLSPIAQVQNGTLVGKHIDSFNQDVFLGIPYAQPPIDTLRFQPPLSINSTWEGNKDVVDYGDACIETGFHDNFGLPQSEDCLTLNIVKPSVADNDTKLPVAIWIHGGGFISGSSRRDLYNLSYIVEQSVLIDKPFIGVSINYRLSGFGFLNSREVGLHGWTNVGLRDQIKAIEWIHENIGAFGGDPEHLVIWGESAGAISVGELLLDNVGDYVKGAILQSGAAIFKETGVLGSKEDEFKRLTNHLNCTDADSPISCLQQVNEKDLTHALNKTNEVLVNGFAFPYVDGDIISKSPYQSLKEGSFKKIPLLIGTNTDEGSGFANSSLDSAQDFKNSIKAGSPLVSKDTLDKLDELYPNDDETFLSPLQPTYNNTPIDFTGLGSHYRRAGTLQGDLLFNIGARIQSRIAQENGIPVYKYRFNIPDSFLKDRLFIGASHFSEVVYVFNNNVLSGNFNEDERSDLISDAISRLWISFITDLNPNTVIQEGNIPNVTWEGERINWPDYLNGENLVFDLNRFYTEKDNWRNEPFEFVESVGSQFNF